MASRSLLSRAATSLRSQVRSSRFSPSFSGREACIVRFFTTPRPTSALVARYHQYGQVDQVVKIEEEPLPELKDNEVLIKFLAAPINPADINMIEGVYNIKPPMPAVGGNEGVAVITHAGPNANKFKVGDWVIPSGPGFGTWRTFAVAHEDVLEPIANDIPAEMAATVSVNPCSAYRMLHDFVPLKPGDVVIQNGANSAVGQSVIALAHQMGVKTINILRDRPNLDSTVHRLKQLGADVVVTEEFVSSLKMRQMMKEIGLPRPVLGLNCVGGQSSIEVSRWLADQAPMVTYGGMGRKPVQVPTGRLIFNDISLRGFWLSRWVDSHTKEERRAMISSLTDMIRDQKLSIQVERQPFTDFSHALQRAREPFRDAKVVLVMPEEVVPGC